MKRNTTRIVETVIARLVSLAFTPVEARAFVQVYLDADDVKSLEEFINPRKEERLIAAGMGIADKFNPITSYYDWDSLGERVVHISEELTSDQKLNLTQSYPELRLQFASSPQPHGHGEYAARRHIETELCLAMVLRDSSAKRLIDLGGNDFYHARRGRDWVHCECPTMSERDEARYVHRDFLTGDTSSRCRNRFEECDYRASRAIAIHSTYDIPVDRLVRACVRRSIAVMVGCMNVPLELPNPGRLVVADGISWEGFLSKSGDHCVKMFFTNDPSEPYLHRASVIAGYAFRQRQVLKSQGHRYLYAIESRRGSSIIFSLTYLGDMSLHLPPRVVQVRQAGYYYVSVPSLTAFDIPVEKGFFDRLVLESASEFKNRNFNITSLFRWAKSLRQQIVVNGSFVSNGYSKGIDELCFAVVAAYVVGAMYAYEIPYVFSNITKAVNTSRSKGFLADVTFVALESWKIALVALFDVATLGVRHVPGLLAAALNNSIGTHTVSVRSYHNRLMPAMGPVTPHSLIQSEGVGFSLYETSSDADSVLPSDSASHLDPPSFQTLPRSGEVSLAPTVQGIIDNMKRLAVDQEVSIAVSHEPLSSPSRSSRFDEDEMISVISEAMESPVALSPLAVESRGPSPAPSLSGRSRADIVEVTARENAAIREYIGGEERGREATAMLWRNYGRFVVTYAESEPDKLRAVLDIEPDQLRAVRKRGGRLLDILAGDFLDYSRVSTAEGLLRLEEMSEGDLGIVNQHCRVFIYSEIIDVASMALDLPAFVPTVTLLTKAPAGAGKTRYITMGASETDVVVAATRAAADVIKKWLVKKPLYTGTAAALILKLFRNPQRFRSVINLYVDEALLLHSAVFYILSRLLRPKYLLGYGDPHQVVAQSFVTGYRFSYSDYPWAEQALLQYTRRMPADVCVALERFYGFVVGTYNPVQFSVVGPKYIDGDIIPDLKERAANGAIILVYTNSYKKELRLRGVRAITVGESQGETYKDVVLIREYPRDMYLYLDPRYALVALSRHTNSFVYYTATLDDRSAVSLALSAITHAAVMGVKMLDDDGVRSDVVRVRPPAQATRWADYDDSDDETLSWLDGGSVADVNYLR